MASRIRTRCGTLGNDGPVRYERFDRLHEWLATSQVSNQRYGSGFGRYQPITWIEIIGGFDHSDQALLAKNTVTLALFDIIEISAEVSALAARILSERLMDRRAKKQDKPKFRPPDAIIHATALLHADQLITSNGADVKDVRCHKNILVKPPL